MDRGGWDRGHTGAPRPDHPVSGVCLTASPTASPECGHSPGAARSVPICGPAPPVLTADRSPGGWSARLRGATLEDHRLVLRAVRSQAQPAAWTAPQTLLPFPSGLGRSLRVTRALVVQSFQSRMRLKTRQGNLRCFQAPRDPHTSPVPVYHHKTHWLPPFPRPQPLGLELSWGPHRLPGHPKSPWSKAGQQEDLGETTLWPGS